MKPHVKRGANSTVYGLRLTHTTVVSNTNPAEKKHNSQEEEEETINLSICKIGFFLVTHTEVLVYLVRIR